MSNHFIHLSTSLIAVTTSGVLVSAPRTTHAQSRRHFPLPVSAHSLATADIDHDGDTDVIASGDELMVFMNLGGGDFVETQRLGRGGGPILVGDVDGDDDLDLVTQSSGVQTYINTGDGHFLPPIESFFGLSSPVLADVDNDGQLNFVGGSFRSFSWATYDGAGGFVLTGSSGAVGRIEDVAGLVAGDIDADGDIDVAVVGCSNRDKYYGYCVTTDVEIAINEDGVGKTWSECTPRLGASSGSGTSWGQLVSGDLDNNGDLEHALTVYIFEFSGGVDRFGQISDCDGNRGSHWSGSQNASDFVRLADVDGDGRIDAVGAHNPSYFGQAGRLKVYLNSGDLAHEPRGVTSLGTPIRDLVLSDVSGDGIPDAIALTGTPELVVILNNGGPRNRPTLGTSSVVRGQSTDFTITNVAPDAEVGFAYSYDGPGVSRGIQSLGWSALDLNGNVEIAGFATADSNGNATLSFAVPPDAPLRTLTVQAVATSGGGINNTIKSNFTSVPVEDP